MVRVLGSVDMYIRAISLHSLGSQPCDFVEVKLQPEHVESGGQMPIVEPITSSVVDKMEQQKTEVTIEQTKAR